MAKLTDEQKEQLIDEFAHYISMDCFDFTLFAGGVTVEVKEAMDKLGKEANDA